MATGVNQGRQGALAYWMLNMISLFSCNLGRRGGNIYSRGMTDVVQNSERKREDPFFQSGVGEIRTVSGNLPAARMTEFVGNPDDPIRALIVISGNPSLSVGGEETTCRALADVELIVSIDLYRTVTGEISDYVLPATDWLEHEDVQRCCPRPSHPPVFSIAVQHDDGLIDCCPNLFRRAYSTAEDILGELAAEPPDQLELVTRRTPFMVNSWLHNLPVLKQAVHQDNPLEMNPDDADRLYVDVMRRETEKPIWTNLKPVAYCGPRHHTVGVLSHNSHIRGFA